MGRKIFITFLIVVMSVSAVFAANWYDGQNITRFELRGIKNISVIDVDNILYPYRGKQYSDSVLNEIEKKLYKVSGVDFIETEAKRDATSNQLVLSFTFHELPLIGTVSFEGNSKLKNTDLVECLTEIKSGSFVNLEKKTVSDYAKKEILDLYQSCGFDTVGIEMSVEDGESSGVKNVRFVLTEGIQSRVIEVEFKGNTNITASLLKKQLASKKKSLLEKGYLNYNHLATDCQNIKEFYKNSGYLDVIVAEPVVEDITTGKHDYRETKVTYEIIEGSLWHFGGIEVSGNTVFSDDEIKVAIGDTLLKGDVLNYRAVQAAINAISDLYYNNGYISTVPSIEEERDDTDMSVLFKMSIVEGKQSVLENITFSGLKKTKEKVMRRELEFKEGDVFSKTKLQTSAQNLFNTGLLSDIDYQLENGSTENGVDLNFELEEGSTMDIQFGATFGGSATGFPISGFLSWSNNNFRGLGQSLSVSTTLSPSSQSLGISFGDDWFLNHRWANSFSFSFSHTLNEDEYQLGTNSPAYDGDSATHSFPKPFQSYEDYMEKSAKGISVAFSDLMDYDLYTLGFGYNTGYTWIYDAGRLGVSGGLSFTFNKAQYDSSFTPYRELISEYQKYWRMSNKLSLSVQWDGRDYVTNTTKGYVISLGGTTAGGILGGISNYNKLYVSAAGYRKIVDIPSADGLSSTPLMFCASSSFNIMLPQFRFYGTDKFTVQPAYKGATQDEMLYIDGMIIARGHDVLTYQSMLWDNMLEISYQLVPGVVQAEAFVSGTYVKQYLGENTASDGWYLGTGIGLKLKVSGFPLGFYLVDNAKVIDKRFELLNPFDSLGKSGLHFVLAISTSLI